MTVTAKQRLRDLARVTCPVTSLAVPALLSFQVGDAFLPGDGSRLLDLGGAESGVEMAGGLWIAERFRAVDTGSLITQLYFRSP